MEDKIAEFFEFLSTKRYNFEGELAEEVGKVCYDCEEYYVSEDGTYNYCNMTTCECFNPQEYIACPRKCHYYFDD